MTLLARRPLADSGLSAAPLGLAGSYGIDADGVERAFHELGVSYFFFTGRDDGLREGLRRLIAKGHRQELVIAGGANVPTGFGVRSAFEKDLKILGTDYLDVFQLFWVQAHWYVTGQTWPSMRKLKEEGRVKLLGMSIHDRLMARRLVDELSLDMLMIRYNAAHRGAEKEIFASLPEKRPVIVAYTATRWGKLLAPAGDRESRSAAERFEAKPLGGLGGGAPHLNRAMSPEECYRFALSHDKVDVVLCGPKTYAELEQNARGVALGPLAPERLAEVRAFGDVVRSHASSRLVFGT